MIEFSTLCLVLSVCSTALALCGLAYWVALQRDVVMDEMDDIGCCKKSIFYALCCCCCSCCEKCINGGSGSEAYHTICLDDQDLEAFLDRPYD